MRLSAAGNKSSHWIGTVLLTSCELLERPSKKDGFCFKVFHPLNQSIWATKVTQFLHDTFLKFAVLFNTFCGDPFRGFSPRGSRNSHFSYTQRSGLCNRFGLLPNLRLWFAVVRWQSIGLIAAKLHFNTLLGHLLTNYCVMRSTQPSTSSGTENEWQLTGYEVWVIGKMVCLPSAPWVQLIINVYYIFSQWCHWLMPISCHLQYYKALLVTSRTNVSSAVTRPRSLPLPFCNLAI